MVPAMMPATTEREANPVLTKFQLRLARLFLAMPEASGFALAGGAALIFWKAVDRGTVDLDFFTATGEEITLAAERFRARLRDEGLDFDVVQSSPAFVRMAIHHPATKETVLVDVGHDYRLQDAVATEIGSVLSVEELAADKLLALFGRAEARDFVDVFALHRRLGFARMLQLAKQKDPGLDLHVLAGMLARFERLPRREFETDDETFAEMASFFRQQQALLIDRCLTGPDE